jgi:putative transposase
MVRAGVVRHPSVDGISGYNEIQTPPKRYSIINQQTLNNLFCSLDENHFRKMSREWVDLE